MIVTWELRPIEWKIWNPNQNRVALIPLDTDLEDNHEKKREKEKKEERERKNMFIELACPSIHSQ